MTEKTDIVARLRDMQQYGTQLPDPYRTACGEAADEIERLWAHLAQDDMDISNLSRAGLEYRARIEEIEAEIENLREKLHQATFREDMGR